VLIQKRDIAERNVFSLWVTIGKFVFCVNRKVIAGCATRTDMLFLIFRGAGEKVRRLFYAPDTFRKD
jgi:hypothetical protein